MHVNVVHPCTPPLVIGLVHELHNEAEAVTLENLRIIVYPDTVRIIEGLRGKVVQSTYTYYRVCSVPEVSNGQYYVCGEFVVLIIKHYSITPQRYVYTAQTAVHLSGTVVYWKFNQSQRVLVM